MPRTPAVSAPCPAPARRSGHARSSRTRPARTPPCHRDQVTASASRTARRAACPAGARTCRAATGPAGSSCPGCPMTAASTTSRVLIQTPPQFLDLRGQRRDLRVPRGQLIAGRRRLTQPRVKVLQLRDPRPQPRHLIRCGRMRRSGHKPHPTTAGGQLSRRHAGPASRNHPAPARQHRPHHRSLRLNSYFRPGRRRRRCRRGLGSQGPFSSRPLSRSWVRGRATCPGFPRRSRPSRPAPARSPAFVTARAVRRRARKTPQRAENRRRVPSRFPGNETLSPGGSVSGTSGSSSPMPAALPRRHWRLPSLTSTITRVRGW